MTPWRRSAFWIEEPLRRTSHVEDGRHSAATGPKSTTLTLLRKSRLVEGKKNGRLATSRQSPTIDSPIESLRAFLAPLGIPNLTKNQIEFNTTIAGLRPKDSGLGVQFGRSLKCMINFSL